MPDGLNLNIKSWSGHIRNQIKYLQSLSAYVTKIQQLLIQMCIPKEILQHLRPSDISTQTCHPNPCEVLPGPTGPLSTVMRIDCRIWKHVVNPGLMDES